MRRIYFKLSLVLVLLFTACSTSIDKMDLITNGIDGQDGQDGKDGTSITASTETTDEGWVIILYTDGVPTDTILIPYPKDGVDGVDGQDGKDGENGIDGIDGIDGINGVSVTVTTEETEGGTYIFIQTGDQIQIVFVPNGTDGIDGVDGIDGIDGNPGEDGVSCTIRTEESEGGYYIIFLEDGEEVNRIFVYHGYNGINGQDGSDGLNGLDGLDGADGDTIDIVYTDEGLEITITHYDGSFDVYYVYNGTNGTDGADGADGTDGQDGTNGTNGTDGHDGHDGTNGTDGANGTDGLTSIIKVYQEGDCVVIISGLDLDDNMQLDEDEILYIEEICGCSLNPCDECNECGDCEDDDGKEKVALCHKVKRGNKWVFVTLYLPESAVQAHLDHGDTLGECEN